MSRIQEVTDAKDKEIKELQSTKKSLTKDNKKLNRKLDKSNKEAQELEIALKNKERELSFQKNAMFEMQKDLDQAEKTTREVKKSAEIKEQENKKELEQKKKDLEIHYETLVSSDQVELIGKVDSLQQTLKKLTTYICD